MNIPFKNGVSASGDGAHLYLARKEEKEAKILHYDGQREWERRKGPGCESNERHIEVYIIYINLQRHAFG